MPQTPEERRKTFDALAAKRQEMIARERDRQLERERAATAEAARQKQASLEEQRQARERGDVREEWRQEQHAKKEESLQAARLAAEDQARADAKKAKEAEEDAERVARMRALHDRAVTQKVAARKLQAEHLEEDAVAQVDDGLERELRDIRHLLERALEHLAQDRRKKIAAMEDDARRQQVAMAERYAVRKKELETSDDPKAGGALFQLTATHKRALLTLQERVEATRATIESEYVRLKDEAAAQAAQKEARLRAAAAQRLREAKTRHENADEWIDSHRG
jgi:hypothetical protein